MKKLALLITAIVLSKKVYTNIEENYRFFTSKFRSPFLFVFRPVTWYYFALVGIGSVILTLKVLLQFFFSFITLIPQFSSSSFLIATGRLIVLLFLLAVTATALPSAVRDLLLFIWRPDDHFRKVIVNLRSLHSDLEEESVENSELEILLVRSLADIPFTTAIICILLNNTINIFLLCCISSVLSVGMIYVHSAWGVSAADRMYSILRVGFLLICCGGYLQVWMLFWSTALSSKSGMLALVVYGTVFVVLLLGIREKGPAIGVESDKSKSVRTKVVRPPKRTRAPASLDMDAMKNYLGVNKHFHIQRWSDLSSETVTPSNSEGFESYLFKYQEWKFIHRWVRRGALFVVFTWPLIVFSSRLVVMYTSSFLEGVASLISYFVLNGFMGAVLLDFSLLGIFYYDRRKFLQSQSLVVVTLLSVLMYYVGHTWISILICSVYTFAMWPICIRTSVNSATNIRGSLVHSKTRSFFVATRRRITVKSLGIILSVLFLLSVCIAVMWKSVPIYPASECERLSMYSRLNVTKDHDLLALFSALDFHSSVLENIRHSSFQDAKTLLKKITELSQLSGDISPPMCPSDTSDRRDVRRKLLDILEVQFGLRVEPKPEYHICRMKWSDFDITDLAMLAETAYWSSEQCSDFANRWYNGSVSLVSSSIERKNSAVYREYFNHLSNVTVVSVRGTWTLGDFFQDVDLYSEVMFLQAFSSVFPSVFLLPRRFIHTLVYFISLLDPLLLVQDRHYYFRMIETVREILGHAKGDVIVVGHSLGGAIAQIVSSHLSIPAVTFSSPGNAFSSLKFGMSIEQTHRLVLNVVPDGDPVTLVDFHVGAVQQINCPSVLRCHALVETIKELMFSCGRGYRYVDFLRQQCLAYKR